MTADIDPTLYKVLAHWDIEQRCWIGYAPDLPGCIAKAHKYSEVVILTQLEVARHIRALQEAGLPIPTPRQLRPPAERIEIRERTGDGQTWLNVYIDGRPIMDHTEKLPKKFISKDAAEKAAHSRLAKIMTGMK